MSLSSGRRLVRLRDHREFQIVEVRQDGDAKSGVSEIYRLLSAKGDGECEYSNDVELKSSRTRFRVVPDGSETFRLPR
ncbi:hypothetical protein EON81_00970 [bacterium]|nr:MAG: hypothetical protein EON81_00970 [bacterium]